MRLLRAVLRAAVVGIIVGVGTAIIVGLVVPATIQGSWSSALATTAFAGGVGGALQTLVDHFLPGGS